MHPIEWITSSDAFRFSQKLIKQMLNETGGIHVRSWFGAIQMGIALSHHQRGITEMHGVRCPIIRIFKRCGTRTTPRPGPKT